MSDRSYPISQHKLRRRAEALKARLQDAQHLVTVGGEDTHRLIDARLLLAEYGVKTTDRLDVHHGRLFHYRVTRDPQ